MMWFDSEGDAYKYCKDILDLEDDDIAITSLTFIRSSLEDNPSLGKEYKRRLMSMPPKQRAELLGGNWQFDASKGVYFKRDWVDIVEPSSLHNVKFKKIVRAWDTASSPVSQVNKNPDWTVGVKMGVSEEGYIYILDVIRFRESIGTVKEEMLRAARKDGTGVHIIVPLDPGGHGRHAYQDHVKNLAGFVVRKAKTEKSKLERFLPFASMAENGLLKVVHADWNNAFFGELEGFVGDGKKKDDQVDATSDGYKEINSGLKVPTDFTLNMAAMSSGNIWDVN